ncbi:hypothetical protein MHYP_G00019080 [Metynnis hypsauchen]
MSNGPCRAAATLTAGGDEHVSLISHALQTLRAFIHLLQRETTEVLEEFTLPSLLRCDSLISETRFSSLLLLVTQSPTQKHPSVLFFNCAPARAELIRDEVRRVVSDYTHREKRLSQTGSMDYQEIPSPPRAQAPFSPPPPDDSCESQWENPEHCRGTVLSRLQHPLFLQMKLTVASRSRRGCTAAVMILWLVTAASCQYCMERHLRWLSRLSDGGNRVQSTTNRPRLRPLLLYRRRHPWLHPAPEPGPLKPECYPPQHLPEDTEKVMQVNDELLRRLTNGKAALSKPLVIHRSADTSVPLDYRSPPAEVEAWLRGKGFSEPDSAVSQSADWSSAVLSE